MNILYDISVLGRGHFCKRSRAGIFLATRNLALALDGVGKQNGLLSVSFSAAQALLPTMDFVREEGNNSPFQRLIFSDNGKIRRAFHQAVKSPVYFEKSESLFHKNVKRISKKISTVFSGLDIWYSNFRSYEMNPRSIVGFNIYHSTFYSFPRNVMENPRIKKVMTVYDLIPLIYPEYFSGNEKKMLLRAIEPIRRGQVTAVCISDSTKKDLMSYLGTRDDSNIFSVPLAASDCFQRTEDPMELKRIRKKYSLPEFPYLLAVGTVEPRKNLLRLIRCFLHISNQPCMKNMVLIIVGTEGWKCENMFHEINEIPAFIRKRIRFCGYVQDEDLPYFYSAAEAFVYPSLYEGFGLPILEAMKCGCPVIASNVSSIPEVAGDAALLVDPLDEEDIREKILMLMRDRSLRDRLSVMSAMRANEYSWEKTAKHFLKIYQSIQLAESSVI